MSIAVKLFLGILGTELAAIGIIVLIFGGIA